MKTLKVGIIGCGSIATAHLNALSSIKQAEIHTFCDLEIEKAQSLANKYEGKSCRDYQEVLKNPSIELVHILLPHYLHVPIAIEALKAGKFVILEKPVGINREELLQLQQVADGAKRPIGVILQNRFNPTTQAMRASVRRGELGQLVAAKASLYWNRPEAYYSQSSWRGKIATEGGGLLINQAIHTLDLMAYIGGPISDLQASIANYNHPSIEVEDTAMIAIQYHNGAVGSFFATNNYGDNSPIEMSFLFERGELRLSNQTAYLIQNGQEILMATDQAIKGPKAYWGDSHSVCIASIYKSFLEQTALEVTLEEAIEATLLVLKAYEA